MSNALTATGGFAIDGMQGAMKLATAMASAKMVPQHLQGSPGDCLMVIEQAMRWQMSPFAVAQATAIVRGKMCFEGKLVAAAIQTSGILEGRLRYDFEGDGENRKVICSGHIRGESKERTVEVTLESAKTNNEWWTKTPDQMLTYHAARVWARRHAPEVMLGVYSPDEFDEPRNQREAIDVTPDAHATPTPPAQRELTEEERHERYVTLYAGRANACTNTECCDGLWKAWDMKIDQAREIGKPIPSKTVDAVRNIISERTEAFRQEAYTNAPVDAVPA
ncbi:recombinase RecT [Acetobacter oryzifermentans]|uniref:recombinase RecT n=1 Tax=Acetobacter oryzifermentans TaxID=1633874 RepID=UPI0039BF3AE3